MWGENWGQLIWGHGVSVPALSAMGLVLLGAALASVGIVLARRRSFRRASPWIIGLLILGLPLYAMSDVVLPYSFTNGTIADATQVNGNFGVLTTAVNSHGARLRSYVGLRTVAGVHPSAVGGYLAADALCASSFSGSVVCTPPEILESARHGLLPGSGGGNLNSLDAGVTPPNVADCRGWTGEGYMAGVNFSAQGPIFLSVVNACTTTTGFNLACCR